MLVSVGWRLNVCGVRGVWTPEAAVRHGAFSRHGYIFLSLSKCAVNYYTQRETDGQADGQTTTPYADILFSLSFVIPFHNVLQICVGCILFFPLSSVLQRVSPRNVLSANRS